MRARLRAGAWALCALAALAVAARADSTAPATTIEMNAKSNDYAKIDVPGLGGPGRVRVTMTLVAAHEESPYAPSVYFGFRDPTDTDRFRVFLFQQVPGGKLIVGFDYLEGDKVVLRDGVMKNFPIGKPVSVDLTSDGKGLFHFAIAGADPRPMRTKIRNPIAFRAVSSCKATFVIRRIGG